MNQKAQPAETQRLQESRDKMVPWKKWDELRLEYETYPRGQFYNEVLGLSFDSGMRPLTLTQVQEFCNPLVSMGEKQLLQYELMGHNRGELLQY